MRIRMILGPAASIALSIGIGACGTNDTKQADNPSTPAGTSVAVATSAATVAAATPAPSEATAITIKAGEYYFEPKDVRARPGLISITMNNAGPERPHTMGVKKKDGSDLIRSQRVEVNQSITLEFTITEEGTYEMYCSLPGHADRGQTGSLTVSRT